MRIRNQARWDGARGDMHAAFENRGGLDWPYVLTWLVPQPDEDRPADEDDVAEFIAGDWIKPTDRAPDAHAQPWVMHGILRRSKRGLLVVSELDIEPNLPGGAEVTGTVLRGVRLTPIRQKAVAALGGIALAREAAAAAGLFNVSKEDAERARRAAAEAEGQPLNRGRKGYPQNHYRRIALRYLDLIGEGRRDVLVALAAEESKRQGRKVPRETIRDWVRKATTLEFLTPGKQGRADARPGPKLYPKEEDNG
jgi:hypothetical protein